MSKLSGIVRGIKTPSTSKESTCLEEEDSKSISSKTLMALLE